MLYKFKSKASGDLIMLEPNGRQMLQIIGKDAGPQGIILPAQMEAALTALAAAVAQDAADAQAAAEQALARGLEAPKPPGVSLRQRAAPFADMLRRCLKADQEIVWGV